MSSDQRPGQKVTPNPQLIHRLLEVMEHEIVPLTAREVVKGNKLFGAAMLNKHDLSTIIADTNQETLNPFHGTSYPIPRTCGPLFPFHVP